jgi:hypothetical protein
MLTNPHTVGRKSTIITPRFALKRLLRGVLDVVQCPDRRAAASAQQRGASEPSGGPVENQAFL